MLQCSTDAVDQLFFLEGLLEKSKGASFGGPLADVLLTERGNENHW